MKKHILIFAALACFGVAAKAQQQKPPKPQVTKFRTPRDSLPPPKVTIVKTKPPVTKAKRTETVKSAEPAKKPKSKTVRFRPPVIVKDNPGKL